MLTRRTLPLPLASLCVTFLMLAPLHAQEYPGAQWTVVPPEAMGMNSQSLAASLAKMKGNVVVVRDGYLVAQKGDVAKRFPLYSVGKSYTSMIFGVLLQKGLVTLDQPVPVSDYPIGPLSTFRQFLSMTSDYGLSPHAPGSHYAYNNKSVQHYGESMRSFFAGKTPLQIFDEQIYGVTGRQDSIWFYGLWSGWGGGFESSARDMARVGLLLLRAGSWQGQQVVPASYVAQLYQNQVQPWQQPSSSTGTGETQGPPGNNWWNQLHLTQILDGNYSFGWWTNASGLYPDIPTETIWADGLNGHRIIVCPPHDLVVTCTYGGDTQTPEMILKPIIDSIMQTPPAPGTVSGELRRWHKVTVSFDGPETHEGATPNPFTDYRLDVTFKKGTRTFVVPGYYAADGDAAESGAGAGNQWRVHFMPDEAGEWSYFASFRAGALVALSANAASGTPVAFHGANGTFQVAPTDKSGADFRGKGVLRHDGGRYLRFAGTGEAFLKGGADSPENLLAYQGFDQTTPTHTFAPHLADWQDGDPEWRGGDGRGLIGALNYLAGRGMNSVYFLTLNAQGDGDDVWPWFTSNTLFRYDVSKLAQWEIAFEHMTRLGLHLHVVTQETENDQLLDGGALGNQRRLYYRELVARFAHHPALTWNLGEENTNTDAERKQFADHLRALDPYDHPIVVHTFPTQHDLVYQPLLGHPTLDGPSLQIADPTIAHGTTLLWLERAQASGQPWAVTVDEFGPANQGVLPDAIDPDHDVPRGEVLWGNLMAGGAGVEWYFGYAWPDDDLDCEDWRSRETMWRQTDHALDFFRTHLPFDQMTANDALTTAADDFCLALPGETYATYLPGGGTTQLDMGSAGGMFTVRWYDPRNGGLLQLGTVTVIAGLGMQSLGLPPSNSNRDWVALVSRVTSHVLTYGQGVPGALGNVPSIGATDPVLGTPLSLTLSDAKPATLACLFVGRKAAATPYFGGTLLNDAAGGWYPFTTDGAGQSAWQLNLPPNTSYIGKSLYFQWAVKDSAAPLGLAMTPGLQTILHF